VSNPRFAPDARITANAMPLPAAMRSSVSRIALQLGLEGADRLELTLVNEGLRWLDQPQIALGRELRLELGYAPDPLDQVFVGEVVGLTPTFPADGVPTLTVVAHDRRARMQRGTKTRWFAIAIPRGGNRPMPDPAVAALVGAESQLIFASDPVSLGISAALGGVEYGIRAASGKSKGAGDQELIRKQRGETDLAFLGRIAAENGWVMSVDHGGVQGGRILRFTSLLAHLVPDLRLHYGENLIDFAPRITTVGEIVAVTVRFWIPQLKIEMTVTAGWDWDRQSLNVTAEPSYGRGGGPKGKTSVSALVLADEVSATTAARVLLAKLLSKLNQRLTGTASTIGDVRFKPGGVVQLDGVGKLFGGPYRVTGVHHTLDTGGFRTSIDVRKEIWFDGAHLMRGFENAARTSLAMAVPGLGGIKEAAS